MSTAFVARCSLQTRFLEGVAPRYVARCWNLSSRVPHPPPSLRRRLATSNAIVAAADMKPAMEQTSTSGDEVNWQAFDAHQRTAIRLSPAEQGRLLLDQARNGVLSTIGSFGAWKGFPVGTVVEYALDAAGKPIFAFSSLSSHTPDVQADPRCSITVTAAGFQGMADARMTLSGVLSTLKEADADEAKQIFLQKNPGSFWVEFGDFSWYRMDTITTGRLVGGFGRIKQISAEEYLATTSDPVAPFAQPIASHMNADHADSITAMVEHYIGVTVEAARIVGLDRLGLDLECTHDGKTFSCRLPFIRAAGGRKDVKDIIVEMTRAAAAAPR